MRLLILQHARFEHVGRFRALLDADDVTTEVLIPAETPPDGWPDAGSFDALWVLGGVMQVWETDKYPWLNPEIDFIGSAVRDWRKPYFGICLGHQLLAQATGGACGPAPAVEFGVLPVRRDGAGDPLLTGLPERFEAFQWHGAEVTVAPAWLSVAAGSGACGNQIMSGPGAVGSVQFHPEVDNATLRDWYDSPGCRDGLVARHGPGADQRLLGMLSEAEPRLAAVAQALYRNWMAMARAALADRGRIGA